LGNATLGPTYYSNVIYENGCVHQPSADNKVVYLGRYNFVSKI